MSSQQKDKKQDDEIWNSLFGGAQNEKSQTQKKGYTTLVPRDKKKSSSSKHVGKKAKSRSSRDRPHQRHHQPQSNGHKRNSNSNSNNNNNYSMEGPTTAERLSQFLCTPKTRARLPPPPLQCKFLKYPHKNDRFTKFCATNLELNYKWEMHHDSLFPLPLDLMDPNYYNPLKQRYEYDDDEQLLNRKEDERILQLLEEREYEKNAKEEQFMPEQEAFLLQTQYLTGGQEYELTESQRIGYDNDIMHGRSNNNNNRNRKGKRNKRDWQDDYGDDDHMDGDITYKKHRANNPHSLENVKQTFMDIQDIKTHPKTGVEVAQMFDVFPHEGLLDNDYTHVQFDKDPIYHTRKCQFMSKYENERIKMSKLATQTALLRCVNRKGLEMERLRNSKMENEMDADDMDDHHNHENESKKEADWFSLYATNGNRKRSEYDDEDIIRYEWAAEFVPVQMDKKKQMHFMVIPIDKNSNVHNDVFYANFNNRLSVRHKQTDSSQDNIVSLGGKKGLSEQDKKFFKQQPLNIKLNVPRANDY